MAGRQGSPNVTSPGKRRQLTTISQAVDEDQLVFTTSSLALLDARRHNHNGNGTFGDQSFLLGAKRVLSFMYRLWQKGKLCDLVLVAAGDKEVHAHKVVLAAHSQSLTARFLECKPGEIVSLNLSDFHMDTVMTLLHFAYTTNIEITDHTAAKLFSCAKELGLDVVVDICQEYLSQFNPDNVILYYSIAEKNGFTELRDHLYAFLCDNFVEISRTKHFCYIPQEKILHLLSDDNIVAASELEVFFALVRWVDYDRENRVPMLASLLRCVRFHLISPEDLVTKVEVVDHIFCILECHHLLYEAYKYHALRLKKSRLAGRIGEFTHLGPRRIPGQPRSGAARAKTAAKTPKVATTMKTQDSVRKKLFVNHLSSPSGNSTTHNNESSSTLQSRVKPAIRMIDEQTNQTSALTTTCTDYDSTLYTYDQTEDEDSTCSARDRVRIIAVGGVDLESLDPDTPGKTLMAYDARTNKWQALPSLPSYTHHHGVVVVGESLYVIGGAIYDANDPGHLGHATNIVHVLNLRTGTWSQAAPMKEKRAYVGVAAHDTCIFAVGGEDANGRKLDSVEYYDPEVDAWCYLARMPTGPKMGCACAVYEGCLYVVGGFKKRGNEPTVLPDVECFDIENSRWVKKKPLTVPRCHASLVVCENRLYLIGGRTKHRSVSTPNSVISLDTVEVLNEIDGSWQTVGELETARHDAGCAAIGCNIYIIGGMQSPTPRSLNSVECFDVEDNRLIKTEINLPHPATGLACCSAAL